jgi:hypothetical protein
MGCAKASVFATPPFFSEEKPVEGYFLWIKTGVGMVK